MKLVKTDRTGTNSFAMTVEHENGQKERWTYERVAHKSGGVDFIQVGKEAT